MADDGTQGRIPAEDLWVTFRGDGAILLELLEDRQTLLGIAESHVEDREAIAEILSAWALRDQTPRMARLPSHHSPASTVKDLQDRYRRDLGLGVFEGCALGLPRLLRSAETLHQVKGLFGTEVPTSPETVHALTSQVAQRVGTHFREMRLRAAERLAGGAYLPVLEAHLARCRAASSDPNMYYRLERTLVPILAAEQYLHVAEDNRARALMAELVREIADLYGRCMTLNR